MSFNDLVVSEKKSFEKPKTGLQNAICCGVWSIGTQKVEFQGEVKFQKKIIIGFELEQKYSDKDEPMIHLEMLTVSLHPKSKLTKLIEEWRSKKLTDEEKIKFDLSSLVGNRATVNLVENGDYINLSSIMPPQDSNKIELFGTFEKELPKWVILSRDKSVESAENEKAPF